MGDNSTCLEAMRSVHDLIDKSKSEEPKQKKIVYKYTHCQYCGAPYSPERENCEYCGVLYR